MSRAAFHRGLALLFLLASPTLWAQSYQTSFTEVKFDRTKGPGTLHGPVEVEGATGAVNLQIPLGPGVGARGVRFQPLLRGNVAPQAWADPPFGIASHLGGFTLHPGSLNLDLGASANSTNTTWTGPEGDSGSLAGGAGSTLPSGINPATILAAFGYSGTSVAPKPYLTLSGPGASLIARGSRGELLFGLASQAFPAVSVRSADFGPYTTPGALLLVRGDQALEFEYTGVKFSYMPGQAPPSDPAYHDKWRGGAGTIELLQSARYRVKRILNRFGDQIQFTYGTLVAGRELNVTAKWLVSGSVKGAVAMAVSGSGSSGDPFQTRITTADASGLTLSTYQFTSQLPADFSTNAATGIGILDVLEHQLLEAWSVDSGERVTLTYGAGPVVSDPVYGYSAQPQVLTKVTSPGRQVSLTWQPYLIRPNMTSNSIPGYKGSLSNKKNWSLGVVTVVDQDTTTLRTRTTTHSRVVPLPTMGWSSAWDSTTFYDAITHPDGQTTFLRYVEPIHDTRTVNQIVGSMTDTGDRQLQTLAHLKHMVKEVRSYAAGVAWSSDLGTAAASSTAYKVVATDRWDLRGPGNPSGSLDRSAVPFPTRTRLYETDTQRFTLQESGNWDDVNLGWRTELSASQTTSSPDLSPQWQGLARQGVSQPSAPSGTVTSRTTSRTFGADPTRWFLGRLLTESAVVTDGTGYQDPKVLFPFTTPTVTKSFNAETNTLGNVSVGSVDGTIQTAFTYNGTSAASLAGSQLAGVTVSGAGLNLSGQVGIQSYGYDGFGFVSSIQARGMSGSLGQSQNVLGRPSQQTDADGRVTLFQWDPVGRLALVTPPGSEVATEVRYEGDHPDHLGLTIRRGSQETQLRYNGYGELVLERRKNLDGSWSHRSFHYDSAGRKAAETVWWAGPGSDLDSIAPNLLQDLTELQCVKWKVLASGTEICTQSANVVLAARLAAGTQWTYDGRGREMQVKDANGVITTTAYAGLVTTRTVAPSTTDAAVTTYTKDLLGRLVRVVDALGQTTNYFHHPNGQIGRVQQPGAQLQTREWSYTSQGWPLQLVQPESGTTTYSSFDVTGRPWVTTYGAGSASPRSLKGTYSPLGQLLTLLGSGTGDVSQAFGYGSVGDGKSGANKLTWATANGVRRDLSYDPGTGRPAALTRSVDGFSWAQGFHYDPYGQLDQRKYPNHSAPSATGPIQTLSYDLAKGMPSGTTYNSSPLATLSIDPVGWMLKQVSFANGASTSYDYWADQARLKTLAMGIPGQVIPGLTYGYDQRGDLTSTGEDYYAYDKLGRLTQAFMRDPWDATSGAGSAGLWQQFGYDAFGNRTALTSWAITNWAAGAVPPTTPTTTPTAKALSYLMSSGELSTMAATNRLPGTIGGVSTGALYDPQGNLTQLYGVRGQSATQVTMAYDSLGRVSTLGDTRNATSQAYLYDDEGLRIKVVDSKTGLTTYNIYNEARQLVATYTRVGSGSLTWKRDIVYVGARELAEVSATGTAVILTDHLGTPRYSWSGSGLPTKQKFLPFGESLAPAGDSAKFAKGYTNHEQTDPSGLIYMQARFYAPWYGRFLSPDPARDQHFEETQSWNIYSYVQNNPVMAIDPNGEELVAIQLMNAKSVSVNSNTRGHIIVVDRSMVPRVAALISGAEASGTRLNITSSFRTNEEQGGLNGSNAVTPAAAGSSPHNAGLALDGTDGKSKALPDSVVDHAEDLGMRWGGNFKRSDDVHVDGVESAAQKAQLTKENQQQWKSGTIPGMTLDAKTGKLAPANVSNTAMRRNNGQTASATSTPSAADSKPSMWNRFVNWLKN